MGCLEFLGIVGVWLVGLGGWNHGEVNAAPVRYPMQNSRISVFGVPAPFALTACRVFTVSGSFEKTVTTFAVSFPSKHEAR